MTPRTEEEEFEYWNRLLAKEGLTVNRGRFPTGKRVSFDDLKDDLIVCSKCIGYHTEQGDCAYV